MVETRAQAAEKEQQPRRATRPKDERNGAANKRKESKESQEVENGHSSEQKRKKPRTSANTISAANSAADVNVKKLNSLISKYGVAPFSDLDELEPSIDRVSETVMAHLFNAMLSSSRISHEIARKTLKCVLRAGYHDLKTLHESTWKQRTEVLTEGGYTHYREKTATAFGDLAKLMEDKYNNDPSCLLLMDDNKDPRSTLKSRLKEIKQMGNVGIEIFMASIQGFYPRVAPFLDSRSFKTAQELGLGDDVCAMFEALDKDPMQMAKLNAALTTVRLEKREKEFL